MTSRGGSAERLRIVVAGLLGALPLAGLTAHYLQYLLGLRKLGHDVLYLEDTGWYFDPWTNIYADEWHSDRPPASARPPAFIDRILRAHGLDGCWTWVDISGEAHGVTGARLTQFLDDADLFLHVTGAGRMRDEYLSVPRRAYVDTDPGFVQLRTARYGCEADRRMLADHTTHFTFGCNIGRPGCSIPDLGLTWHPTVQPVDIDLWPPQPPPPPGAPFKTVVKWSPYEPVEHEGVLYGMKDLEFVKFVDLPQASSIGFELAMDGDPPVPESRLERLGWRLGRGLDVSRSLDGYRSYIASSFGEWSVAKQAYVATASGWFSERSTAFLASGRPVLLQSTGFETWLPVGRGVLSFRTDEDVLSAVEELASDYGGHCRAAREVAAEHFRSEAVLQDILECCGL